MQHLIVHFIEAAAIGAVIRFILRQAYIDWLNILLDPLVLMFWDHAKKYVAGLHLTRSPLKCEQCKHKFYDLPN